MSRDWPEGSALLVQLPVTNQQWEGLPEISALQGACQAHPSGTRFLHLLVTLLGRRQWTLLEWDGSSLLNKPQWLGGRRFVRLRSLHLNKTLQQNKCRSPARNQRYSSTSVLHNLLILSAYLACTEQGRMIASGWDRMCPRVTSCG